MMTSRGRLKQITASTDTAISLPVCIAEDASNVNFSHCCINNWHLDICWSQAHQHYYTTRLCCLHEINNNKYFILVFSSLLYIIKQNIFLSTFVHHCVGLTLRGIQDLSYPLLMSGFSVSFLQAVCSGVDWLMLMVTTVHIYVYACTV